MAISKTKIAAVAAALSVFASTSVVSAFADSAPADDAATAETSSVVVEEDSAAEETSAAESVADETSAADSVADETSTADSVADETSSADDTSSAVESTWADYTADEYAGQAVLTAAADAPDADGNIVVHYTLSGDKAGLAGFAFKVEYDDTAFEVGGVTGVAISGIATGSDTTTSPYSLNWADAFNPISDGELFTITFKPKAALTPGATYTFATHLDSRGNVADADENDYVLGLVAATYTVAPDSSSEPDISTSEDDSTTTSTTTTSTSDSSSKADSSSTVSSSTASANSSSSSKASSSTTTSTKTTTSTVATTKPAVADNNPKTGVAASGAVVLLGLAAVVVAKKRK